MSSSICFFLLKISAFVVLTFKWPKELENKVIPFSETFEEEIWRNDPHPGK